MADTFFESSCPAVVLAMIFSRLSSSEIVRFSTRVSSGISNALAHEADLWPRVVRDKLRRLVPAEAFFDGPTNESYDSLQGVLMSALYADEAATAATALGAAIERAGTAALGAAWTYRTGAPTRRHALFEGSERRMTLVSSDVRVPMGAASLADFCAWAVAFTCVSCGTHGSVARQCAACGILVCIECAVRCGVDDAPVKPGRFSHSADALAGKSKALRLYYAEKSARELAEQMLLPKPHCAFALCADCVPEPAVEARERDDVFGEIVDGPPTLFSPICLRCPRDFSLLCPAHADLCILWCRKCEDRACIPHSCIEPVINNCFICQWTVCYRDACFVGRTMKHCKMLNGCPIAFVCSVCASDGTCPQCGGEVD